MKYSHLPYFYKNIFKKVIKLFVQQQLEFIGIGKMDKKANVIGVTNDIELSFARGTLNGICLIKDWFEEEEREALARHEPKEEPSNEPFPEV